MSFDIADYIALSLLPIWLWRRMGERLRGGAAPDAILEAAIAERWTGRPENLAARRAEAVRVAARAQTDGVSLVAWGDPRYPAQLTTIVDPPPVLWVRGSPAVLPRTGVAIVGSRAGSPYALAVAERLATDLASRGVVIVSGLARGVDAAAHRGALAAGGTVGVLGSGIDVTYPREHEPLAREMCERGAIVSELVPGTPPLPQFFPQRNRIISGLARAVVVIEAGERSGSLITARLALEQGRDVLAVPGNVLTGRNRGAHSLLRDGAKIVETADDILEELRLPGNVGSAGHDSGEDGLLAALPAGEACDLDEISQKSGLPTPALLPRLFELELRGIVRRVGGGRFVRFDRPC